MNYKNKLVVLSGVLLVTTTISGCSTQRMNDLFASSRTLPEGSSTTFEERRAPVLNPGGSTNGTTAKTDGTVLNGRQVPVENNAPSNDALSPSSMSAPVAPVATASTPATTTMPPVSAMQTPVENPVASTPVAADGTYPVLTSVPTVPAHSTQEQSSGEIKSMMAQQATVENSGKSLMNDQNATVMTSPQNGQLVDNAANAIAQPAPAMPAPNYAAETAPAVAPVAPVVVANTDAKPASSGGISSWFHNLFSSDKKPSDNDAKKAPSENAAAGNNEGVATSAPVVPTQTTIAAPAPVQVSAEPAPITPPVAAAPAPIEQPPIVQAVTTPAPAPVSAPAPQPIPVPAQAPIAEATPTPTTAYAPVPWPVSETTPAAIAQPVAEAPAVLHSPVATNSEPSPDSAQAVALVPPAASSGTYSKTRYLAESRYATKRTDDDN